VTGHGWTARRPDETAVRDLPLAGRTVRLLQAAGVPTLGQLRAMSDRELLELSKFGPVAPADVRYLVPAPEGGRR
jgi:DNA-directed RNA polymerase alpha subunit